MYMDSDGVIMMPPEFDMKYLELHGRRRLLDSDDDTVCDEDQFEPADAYFDISPGEATRPSHMRSCFLTLKRYARVSLMGVVEDDIPFPYITSVFKNSTIRGQYMYEREDIKGLIKLAESGVLKLGKEAGQEIFGSFKLEKAEKATNIAEANHEIGETSFAALK